MNTQSAQTPIPDFTFSFLGHLCRVSGDRWSWLSSSYFSISSASRLLCQRIAQERFLQSGDACRHPVQSPDAVGQDGTDSDDDEFFPCSEISWIINHARDRRLGLINDDHSSEVKGQGDNHE
jgi:hypothetical protein